MAACAAVCVRRQRLTLSSRWLTEPLAPRELPNQPCLSPGPDNMDEHEAKHPLSEIGTHRRAAHGGWILLSESLGDVSERRQRICQPAPAPLDT